jgi:hypothetical protein
MIRTLLSISTFEILPIQLGINEVFVDGTRDFLLFFIAMRQLERQRKN